MFDAATDFLYITGADIDAGHAHGDLDRIELDGIALMPERSATNDPLYGKDIAFLMEAGAERVSLDPNASSYQDAFTRKLDHVQMQDVCNRLANTPGIADTAIDWIDPGLVIAEQALSDVSGYAHLDTLIGEPRWQVPMQTTQSTFDDVRVPLNRSVILHIFDTVAAMGRFVDTRGGEALSGEWSVSNKGRQSIDRSVWEIDSYVYASLVQYKALDVTKKGDGTFVIGGYGKEYDAEGYAKFGFLWQMPTPSYLVGKPKDVWVLLQCEMNESGVYDPSGTQSSYDPSRSREYRSETSVYRLVRCFLASEQTITSGGNLMIPPSDLTPYLQTIVGQTGKARWADMPPPPQGAWSYCQQSIYVHVIAVYPVWGITHTAI